MVSYPSKPDDPIRLAPNRALTWPVMCRVWVFIASATMLISGAAALAGYWMPLPFAGLEAGILAIAFWQIARYQQRYQEIDVRNDLLRIISSDGKAQAVHELNPAWVQVVYQPENTRTRRSRLFLASHGRQLEIGPFLSGDEKSVLAARLKQALAQLPIRR